MLTYTNMYTVYDYDDILIYYRVNKHTNLSRINQIRIKRLIITNKIIS